MSTSLPERPDLDELRRQAKELRNAARHGDPDAAGRFARNYPSAPKGVVSLAAAQLVVARELGFASWPQLKAAVRAYATAPRRRAEVFVAASVDGRMREAATILDTAPGIGHYSLEAAAVLGDSEQVRELLAVDSTAAVAIDEVRGWPPLLYVCYSHWHRIDPRRAAGMAEVVRLLLDAGASPNTNDGARQGYRSALKGSVELNNPEVVRVLLETGANPDLGRPIGEAAGHRDHRCLEMLLSHGAKVMAGTWTVGAAVFADDPHAVSLLLDALEGDDGQAEREATEALPDAAATASPDVVMALLAAGADPEAYDDDRGMSALRRAVRVGRNETATLLMGRGATDDSTDIDRFIGACLRADRVSVERLLVECPDLSDRLTNDDHAAVVEAAGSASVAAVGLMLDLGFSPHAQNDFGEQSLHSAAYVGSADVVSLLVAVGADVDARDARFDSTPLAFAAVGSGECAGRLGNWIEVVRLLIDAGASRDGVWIGGKPPSEEVADLLRCYGVTPDDAPGSKSDDDDDIQSRSLGTGAVADVARHLEAAHRDLDIELLGSLLHPEVRWTGVCSNSAQVLDWYRSLLAVGIRSTVESVEVDGDAVVLGLSVARQADGARPAPPDHLYQVFTVENAQVVEIHGYPDRASALTSTRS